MDSVLLPGVVLSVLALLLLVYASQALLLFFAGLLVAIFLRGCGNWISRRLKVGPHVGVLILTLVTVLGIALVAVLLAPQLSTQVDELQQKLPEAAKTVRDRIQNIFPIKRVPAWTTLISEDAQTRNRLVRQALGFASTSIGAFVSVFFVIFVAFYLAFDPEPYRKGVISIFAPGSRNKVEQVLLALDEALKGWLLGKLLSMLVVGVLTGVGLWALGMPIALSLAILAALLTFVPNFGPVIAAIPAILLGSLKSTQTAIYVAILYVVIQFVESYIITPVIQQRTISLPPALIILAQLVMGLLFGILGMAVATPLTAALLVLVQDTYVRPMERKEGEFSRKKT